MHWIDPDSLPETTGVFDHFLLNPHGRPDGLILQDGREVHFPPHMGPEIEQAIAPKAKLSIRAVRPRGAEVLAAVAIDINGKRIDDQGPPEPHDKKPPHPHREDAEAEGVIARFLHGPKGERRGLMLEDGLQVRFPKHLEEETELPDIGAKVSLHGKALDTPHGRVLEVKALHLAKKRKAP
jgi:hypothetical protein